jgi:hypothetical protein
VAESTFSKMRTTERLRPVGGDLHRVLLDAVQLADVVDDGPFSNARGYNRVVGAIVGTSLGNDFFVAFHEGYGERRHAWRPVVFLLIASDFELPGFSEDCDRVDLDGPVLAFSAALCLRASAFSSSVEKGQSLSQ